MRPRCCLATALPPVHQLLPPLFRLFRLVSFRGCQSFSGSNANRMSAGSKIAFMPATAVANFAAVTVLARAPFVSLSGITWIRIVYLVAMAPLLLL